MDTIGKIMASMHFDANIYLHSQFCSPWGMKSDNPGLGSFHVIAYGNCLIKIEGKPDLVLNAGDLVFFPRNTPHRIQNQTHADDQFTTLICGSYDFGEKQNPLLGYLPELIHVSANEISKLPWFESLFRQIVNEAESGTDGKSLILDKLAEILFIYVLRYFVQHKPNEKGLLAALSDKQLSLALAAFHSDIGKAWTVETLAEQANMSRSAFSNYFSELVQLTPMQYVKQWRMQSAYNALVATKASILSIALDHGYQSEAAFSKVFKKQFSITPGKARRQQL
ncbi:AraC family transcriptional regulator [Kangiella sp. HZ709]|uniref:AraC family transcriptional regulator n=1 Tax=Kangiella sp. HZ709 TaxID=2666328 RepID=UPI0012B04844|nr:AraC family transcriptional regulator [Kangiella sp. HZ709]MRX27871.1 helix-turn-helix domain-containing protein [Kangiella sp. HZ709]